MVGELDLKASYPKVLQVTGGGIDMEDTKNNVIHIMHTITREALEELNIDLNKINNEIEYMYVSEKDEQPGVQIFSKAQINMTKKETAVEEIEHLKNPRRNYLLPLIKADSEN